MSRQPEPIGSGESRLETIISYLLITGVIASLVVLAIGIVMLAFSANGLAISQNAVMFIHGHDFFSFIYDQFQGKHADGTAILFITIGIIVLVLTPYLRVVASLAYFAWRKNAKYVVITLFVLVVVTLSLTLH